MKLGPGIKVPAQNAPRDAEALFRALFCKLIEEVVDPWTVVYMEFLINSEKQYFVTNVHDHERTERKKSDWVEAERPWLAVYEGEPAHLYLEKGNMCPN